MPNATPALLGTFRGGGVFQAPLPLLILLPPLLGHSSAFHLPTRRAYLYILSTLTSPRTGGPWILPLSPCRDPSDRAPSARSGFPPSAREVSHHVLLAQLDTRPLLPVCHFTLIHECVVLTHSLSLRTNASPVYLVLFISATYFLTRPCVYCSLLLFILVVALFDFQTPWFEAPLSTETAELALNGTTPFRDSIFEGAGVLAQAANNTAQALVKGALDTVRNKTADTVGAAGSGNYEWVKGLVGKKEWKIQCLDVLIRI